MEAIAIISILGTLSLIIFITLYIGSGKFQKHNILMLGLSASVPDSRYVRVDPDGRYYALVSELPAEVYCE